MVGVAPGNPSFFLSVTALLRELSVFLLALHPLRVHQVRSDPGVGDITLRWAGEMRVLTAWTLPPWMIIPSIHTP